jgi:hypothetical protein
MLLALPLVAGLLLVALAATRFVRARRAAPPAGPKTWDTIDDGQTVWLRFEVDGVRYRTPLGIRRTVTPLTAG